MSPGPGGTALNGTEWRIRWLVHHIPARRNVLRRGVYLGNGTALTQRRSFECECLTNTFVWPTATYVERCSVTLSPVVSAECEMGSPGCHVSPGATLSGCVQEPIPSCEEALAMLGP